MSTANELAAHAQSHDFTVDMEQGVWETDIEADPMVTTSMGMPKSLLDWVRAQAAAQDVRPSGLIRQWIEQRRASDDTPDVEDLTARLERLEHAVFSAAEGT